MNADKKKQREINAAWRKVERLGNIYGDLGRKRRAVKESLFVAIAKASALEDHPLAYKLKHFQEGIIP
jgi:hypothetical protein